MAKSVKPALTILAFAFWQASEAGGFINKAFDQLFSIGLLCLVAFMLYKEWKGSQRYNESRDGRLEKLISNNTVALNNSTAAVKEFTEHQKKTNQELKNIHQRLDQIQSSNGD